MAVQLSEETIKAQIANNYFGNFDYLPNVANIDFALARKDIHILWAEAKKSESDIYEMFVQLILTLGKSRIFNKYFPPKFLACFDNKKIAFIPYSYINDIFYINDFNWKVAPSDHSTKEFNLVYDKVKFTIKETSWVFEFEKDKTELKAFVKYNFSEENYSAVRLRVDKNNFIDVYRRWLEVVKPSININWDSAKKEANVSEVDFFIADLLSRNNESLKELSVILKNNLYMAKNSAKDVLFDTAVFKFKDKQEAHRKFWNRYDRPPAEKYWDYLVLRRDLLVPQDIREIKGAFYTPEIWVKLSQEYLADAFGENYEKEYYIWDCAAGTGNLLHGLANKYNVWASTLDTQDVAVMHDRISNKNLNLLEEHCFQFDFLNDKFEKLPKNLRAIIEDPKKREKLIIYINPPYLEGDSRIGKGRSGTQKTEIHKKYQQELGKASAEIFAQFLARIYSEIPDCKIAEFSKLKSLAAPNFADFRNFFKAKLEKCFIVPADSFDNVTGDFPIGFKIWDLSKKSIFKKTKADIFVPDETSKKGFKKIGKKLFCSHDNRKFISDMLDELKYSKHEMEIGNLNSIGNDFQNQNALFINSIGRKKKAGGRHTVITKSNLVTIAVYFAVRKVIPATWYNDRDQFLYPNEAWKKDRKFHGNCLCYCLFNNNIQSKYGTNHWIPFTEWDVEARNNFESRFMSHFIAGKEISQACEPLKQNSLFEEKEQEKFGKPIFGEQAKKVLKAGQELYKYYHKQPNANVNASFYDIKEYFQGTKNGKMNNKSSDEKYNVLLKKLRMEIELLSKEIESKIYEYAFLEE